MKKLWNFIVFKWNSILLSVSTLWLASIFFGSNRYFVGIVALLFSAIKIIGIYTNNTYMRVTGLVGMNITWAVTAYFIYAYRPLSPWELFAAIAFFGFGISLQERFHE